MNKEVSVIGGDLRQITLASLLQKDGYNVKVYGFDKNIISNKLERAKSMEEASKSPILILPIPASLDNVTINAPFSGSAIHIDELVSNTNGEKIVFAGKPSVILKDWFLSKNIKLLDYFDREELMVKNAIPTAEGALEIAISETPKTIYNSKCLVLGYGRIGKILSKMLKDLGAQVTVSARKCADFAWIEANGYRPVRTGAVEDEIGTYDIIFNTIPVVVLDREVLAKVHQETLVIDLASKPGGVDFQTAKDLGVKVIWALSLPGKVAPITSGEIIKDTIINMLQELEV